MSFLYVLIACWLAVLAGAVWFAWTFLSVLAPAPAPEAEPPVTVIAPIKGAGPLLRPFIERLRSQAYADYRILAVVESEDDPAAPVLREMADEPGAPLATLVAGLSAREGQKVHNLRHGLAHLDASAQIVAFVDADTLPSPDWLVRLVRPLTREEDIAAVTGYRWVVSEGGGWPSAIVAAANASVVTMPRVWNVCWGGTLALRRETIERLDLAGRLEGAVVDDVLITRILHEEGLRILTPRGLVVLSPVHHDWASAFAFAHRQYTFVRWYLPGSWCAATALLSLPVVAGGAALVLALMGDRIALAALLAAVLLGQARASLRARIVAALFGEEGRALFARSGWADRWLAPVWITFHAAGAWSSLLTRRLLWAGTLYEFVGRNETRVIRRGREMS